MGTVARRTSTFLTGLALAGTAFAATSTGAVAYASGIDQLPAPHGAGVFVGAGSPDALKAFGAWQGTSPSFAIDYLARDTWSDIESPTWWTSQWQSTHTQLVLGVPMLLEDGSTDLQSGARGEYNSHFVKLAQTLVANGYANASLRIGWESNGDWYAWSAKQDPQAWVTYFRRIVQAVRSVPGQNFTIDWNMNLGDSAVPAESIYPGDDVVDYVGVDAYDWKWGDSSISPAARWQWILTQSHGLDWVADFAKAHGKQITVPEWGLSIPSVQNGGGGGDDPYYVTAMLAWVQSHDVAYQAYFNVNDTTINKGLYPRAASTFRAEVATLGTVGSLPVTPPVTLPVLPPVAVPVEQPVALPAAPVVPVASHHVARHRRTDLRFLQARLRRTSK